MAGPQMKTYGGYRLQLLCIVILCGVGSISAQCPSGAVCVDTDDNFVRVNGNSVQGHVETALFGDLQYYFYPAVYGWEDKDGSTFGQSSSLTWGSLGGTATFTFSPVTLSLSGAGTYTATGYHEVYCPTSLCGTEVYSPSLHRQLEWIRRRLGGRATTNDFRSTRTVVAWGRPGQSEQLI